ncbi:MAG: murein transglycosylase A, partial [Alphaproteobacteria bacterium]
MRASPSHRLPPARAPLALARFAHGPAAAGLFSLLILIAGCAPRPPAPESLRLTAAVFADLPGWPVDDPAAAVPALARSCARFAAMAPDRTIGPDGVGGRAADWRAPCAALAGLSAGDDNAARDYFERWFTPLRAAGRNGTEGLFTGYFEAELEAARAPGGAYRVPIYRRPPELVLVNLGAFDPALRGRRLAGSVANGRLKPYPDRAAIEGGALAGRGLELFWAKDPVDVFFLQIQGSGRVRLPGGGVARLGYDGHNGQDYVSIGRVLVARGAMAAKDVSMQSLRAWMAADRARSAALMRENPAFIFFRELKGPGPIGAAGVALTPGRSLAVDAAFWPYGAPVWIDVGDGDGDDGSGAPRLRRLVVAQDTGGAIKG